MKHKKVHVPNSKRMLRRGTCWCCLVFFLSARACAEADILVLVLVLVLVWFKEFSVSDSFKKRVERWGGWGVSLLSTRLRFTGIGVEVVGLLREGCLACWLKSSEKRDLREWKKAIRIQRKGTKVWINALSGFGLTSQKTSTIKPTKTNFHKLQPKKKKGANKTQKNYPNLLRFIRCKQNLIVVVFPHFGKNT